MCIIIQSHQASMTIITYLEHQPLASPQLKNLRYLPDSAKLRYDLDLIKKSPIKLKGKFVLSTSQLLCSYLIWKKYSPSFLLGWSTGGQLFVWTFQLCKSHSDLSLILTWVFTNFWLSMMIFMFYFLGGSISIKTVCVKPFYYHLWLCFLFIQTNYKFKAFSNHFHPAQVPIMEKPHQVSDCQVSRNKSSVFAAPEQAPRRTITKLHAPPGGASSITFG